ncbi:hypothetical protein ACI2KR_26305 [Pseudomonas luteola]
MFVPNRYEPIERICALLAGGGLAYWGAAGWQTGALYVPGRYGGLNLHNGLALALACLGILAGVVACIALIVDHYDRRDNEIIYFRVMMTCFWMFVGLLVAACTIELRMMG